MRLVDKLLKRFSVEEKVKQHQAELDKQYRGEELKQHDLPKQTFKQKYPYGLTIYILKNIDYSKYGAILKQQQLLPPSYDRNPVGLEIIPSSYGEHKVGLIFKSKTSASYRLVSIQGYSVTMSINNSSTYEYMPIMSREWQKFCTRIMWLADMGLNSFSMVNSFNLTDEEMGL